MSENRGKFTRDAAQAYLAHEPEMQVEKISDSIWTISDGNCRTIFMEGQTSVIAFDTFGTPGRARAYKKAVADSIPGKAIKTIIYSHDHLDHCGFAADLSADAEIIADEICAKVIKLRQAEGQSQVTKVLNGSKNEMSIDGCKFTLLNPGPTHGSGNISAWFAEDKILFSSDTVLANAKYGFVPDYHLCNFVKFMRGFLELEWDVFVPGRYGLTDRAGFEKGCDYIEAVQIESQNAFAEFVPIWAFEPMKGYVINKLGERFADLEGFEDHVGQTALRIVHHYLMGGWGLEDTPEPSVLLADEVEL
ncbi:MAG: MBL fold metallo-hydrolase [Gammaproteobacteria bacterium]|jgi:glyoxylase-like metal-dependent hydrolase (beta-lactamase superfamily II)|nr:MBL fold metallo-hydrolase [Gammaproteobacteria bacterium]